MSHIPSIGDDLLNVICAKLVLAPSKRTNRSNILNPAITLLHYKYQNAENVINSHALLYPLFGVKSVSRIYSFSVADRESIPMLYSGDRRFFFPEHIANFTLVIMFFFA